MQIIDYRYIVATEKRLGYIAIPELDRYKSSVTQFIKLADLQITLTRPTAFLYLDGATVSQAESGVAKTDSNKFQVALKTLSSHILHEWIHTFQNREFIVYADIISSTCAGGIQAIAEAEKLLNSGVCTEVVIIGGERTTDDTLRLFKELRINVDCGDGFIYLRIQKGGTQIEDVKWKYAFNPNPFKFTRETLNNVLPYYPVNYVKLHGTGSEANTEAEKDIKEFATPLCYKQDIGHTQGISSLLETCIILDDSDIQGNVLITANGLGGFYGAFTLNKS